MLRSSFKFFFINYTATNEIYTLSLHDALPILNGLHDLESMPLSITEKVLHPFGFQPPFGRSEEHTSELQSHSDLVCRLLLEKKKIKPISTRRDIRLNLSYVLLVERLS